MPTRHNIPNSTSREPSLADLLARLETLERKLREHDDKLLELETLLRKLLIERRVQPTEPLDTLADQLSQLNRQLPRRTVVSPYAPPSRPVWN